MTEKPQPSPWNLPNALTVLRILLVPLSATNGFRNPRTTGSLR